MPQLSASGSFILKTIARPIYEAMGIHPGLQIVTRCI
jgi:hypothetical protein